MPLSTKYEQVIAAPSNCAVASLIELYLFSLENKVVANTTTKKVNEHDTKYFQNVLLVGTVSFAVSTNVTFWKCFCILFIYFFCHCI